MNFSGQDAQDPDNLYHKLDALQQALDALPERLGLLIQEQLPTAKNSAMSSDSKDVLNDDERPITYQPGANHRVLSPEAQIQRLTAQLTAAYNRIAALEEQLLSQRNLV